MNDARTQKLVLLAQRGDHANIVYNALAPRYPITAVLLEGRVGSWTLIQRRMKRLGVWKTLGQVVFRVGIAPLLALAARARTAELMREYGLTTSAIPAGKIETVASVNSPECMAALARLSPDIVIVAGTRILSEAALAAAPGAVFVNIHAGITPLYRGVHGGYWALAENDAAHCGVTVHVVDQGIDTGGILAQAPITPALTTRDNFATYGLLQTATGLALLRDTVLPRLIAGDRATQPAPAGESRLWSHPTAWEYVRTRVQRGVK